MFLYFSAIPVNQSHSIFASNIKHIVTLCRHVQSCIIVTPEVFDKKFVVIRNGFTNYTWSTVHERVPDFHLHVIHKFESRLRSTFSFCPVDSENQGCNGWMNLRFFVQAPLSTLFQHR